MRKTFRFLGLILLILLVPCAAMAWLAGERPVERDVTVQLDGLPPDAKPLRIVLMSDFHVARFGNSPARLRETIGRIEALRPDMILLAGDFLADPLLGGYWMRWAIEPLKGISAPLGVFAVLGNHDYENVAALRVLLERAGVRLLDNSAARAGPLTIVGISDEFTRHARVPLALASAKRLRGTPIVLTHSPDIIPELPPDVRLALAGHTHCGQVVLPLVGPLDTRSRYGRRYACGIVREGRRTSIISGGLGVSRLPFRFGAPPDFWVITVVPSKAR